MKTLRYIIITLLLVAALQAARAQYVIDKVCLGAQRHYRIDGVANSTYLWQLTDDLNNPVTLTNPTGTSFTTTNPPTTGSEIIIQWAKPLINPGTYKLIAIQYSQAGCDTLQQGEVQVFDLPTANAGNPVTICANLTVTLADASATNYSTLLWTTSGDGVFDNPVSLHPVYTPGTNDKLSGNVTLTLTADGQGNSGSCTPAVSSLTVTISKVLAASISITADQTTVCAGATVTFTAVPVNGGSAPVYQWTVNGANVGTSSATYAYIPVNGDKVTVVMTSSETCVSGSPATSNELTIAVNNPLPASVSITADQTTVCAGATVTFTAVPVNGGSAPVYQWTVNGANVGTSSATYAYIPANGDKVTVVMTSSETCVSGSPATSNELTITVNNPIAASVSITADQTTVCAGATVTFTAIPVNGGSAPVYQWTVNGANVGTSSSTYSYIPANGDKVTVVMTSSETCVSGSPATSNELVITVNLPIIPTFAAVAPICSGDVLAPLPVTSVEGITGTWSPALNNTATTTYTFTPTAGQCATTATLTITVNPSVTATFAAVAPICSGDALAPLPTTSVEGITGTWSPALNNTATTTYTFTPAAGQCATTATLTITVNPSVTATFAAVAPICSGDVLAPLPVTSVEGITGTWSPALNNTATTTYTFTPTAGQCATTATLTITVNPSVTATFAAVAPICSGDVLAPLPTTSVEGITGTWSPALNNTATTTYTFTPAAGQCATTATLTITVNPSVTATFAAVAPICSGDVLAPLPVTSVEGITGTWSPALNNTATTTYTFTPAAGQCATTATLTITVNPSVTATFAAVAPICSGDVLAPLPVTSVEGITGTWSPALNNTATTTYTFTPAAGHCATTATLTITVNPSVTATFAAVAPICSGDPLAPLPTTSVEGITGTWSPALNNTATTTYTFTPAAGQCATTATLTITVNPSVTATFTAVAPICSGDALAPLPTTSVEGITGTWSPALNNTATTTYTFTPAAGQCATTATLTITVNPSVTATFAAVAPICSGDVLAPLPTTSVEGITGTWSPALNNTATTTYTFTPTAGQCATTATLTITVNPSVTVTFAAVAPICSGDVLTPLPTTSVEGITGTWSPALNNTATTTYTFTPIAGQCATTATLTITVNPSVTATFAAVAPICSGDALAPLPTTSVEGITGTWSPALNNTATTTYTFIPTAGQCATTATLTITVNPSVTATFAAVAPICSGDVLAPLPVTSIEAITGTWSPALNNTATTTYTFTPAAGQCATTATLTITVNPSVTATFAAVAPICSGDVLAPLPTTSVEGITGTWSPALNNTATTTYTFTPAAGQCATTATLTITVNPSVTATFAAVAPICSGDVLAPLPTTSVEGITGTWSPALNNTATTTYTFTPTAGQCATTATLTITVNPSVTATFAAVAPICSGDVLAPLPTTSVEGITGTWSPALNNTATTTYTFTPAAGQCATTATLTITVNPSVTATFAAVAPICSGDVLAPLPVTSVEGITGTWSPALNNTATTTYTFTPAAGQCATTATLTITVNPSVTATFAAVAPICSGDVLAPLPVTSVEGITGTWSPALNNTATTTYTFTPAAGQCATTATLTITVNPSVTATFAAVAPICSGDVLAPLPTTSVEGITGTWSPALNNTATTTYTFTPTAGQCATTATLTITVNPSVTATFAAVAPICSGDVLAPLPTTSVEGITGTWSPALNNTATTTYTFTPAAGQCATTATLTITVNPSVTATFAAVAPICSGDVLAPLPVTSVEGITGTWSPALNNTATTTYTFTPAAGQCATTATLTITVNPSVTATFAAVAPICSGDVLAPLPTTSVEGITGTWSPALNNTATTTYTFTPAAGQCATTATLTITVNPSVTATFAAVAPICSGDVLAPLPTTSVEGITGTWSPALNNTATTTYTFTPTAGQCATTATLTITVNPSVTATFTAVAPICSGDVLAPLPVTSVEGITGTWSPALNNTATTTYTFTPAAGQCATTATLTITVNPSVTATFAAVSSICSGDVLAPLPVTSVEGITGTWSPALNNTATTTYTFTPTAGQCATTATLKINVNNALPAAVTITVDQPTVCAGEIVTFTAVAVNGGSSPAYQWLVNGIPRGTNRNTYSYAPVNGDKVAVVLTSNETCAMGGPVTSNELTISVSSAPEVPIASVIQPTCSVSTGSITITAPTPSTGISYTLVGTNPAVAAVTNTTGIFESLASGDYELIVENGSCVSATTRLTINKAPLVPVAPTANVTVQPNCTFGNGTIVVSSPAEGSGYSYSIDGGISWVLSTIFIGQTPGIHSIIVKENLSGCLSAATSVTVNDLPAAPAAPTASVTVQPTCSVATGTIVVTAPAQGSGYSYSIDGGTTWVTSATFAGLVSGSYNVIVKETATGCVSAATTLTVNTAPGAPAAPTASVTIQPTCAVGTGTIVVTAPAEGSGYSYSIDGGTTWSASATFAGLVSGNYNIIVKETATGCVSAATTLTVNAAPGAPAAPTASVTVQPTCSVGTGTIVVTAPIEGSGYSYSIDGGTTWSVSATFAGLVSGSYNVIVKETATGCISAATALTVNAAPGAPAAPTASVTIQPTCAVGTGTIVVTAPAEGSGYSYSIDGGTTWSASATFAGMITGNYNLIVKETATGCISAATALTVNAAPGTPAAPTVSVTVQPNCSVGTGTIVVTAPIEGSGYSYSIDGGTTWSVSATFAGLVSGSYNVIVKETATGCVSAATTLTVNTAPGAPAAPTASVTIQPTCAVGTGTIVVTAPIEGSGYSYSIDGGTTWVTSATFAGLVSGSYNVIVKETATGCISAATALTVNAAPGTPAVPIVGTITQPTCSIPTGSVLLSGLPATGTWTLTRNPGGTTTTGTGTNTTVSGLAAGTTYTFTVTNAGGCTSTASANVVINAAPGTPAAPTARVTVQPTCAVGTGTIVVTAPAEGSGYSYSIDGGITWSASATFAGLITGNYNVIVKETATGCISAATVLTVNTAPGTPAVPIVGTITQPTCSIPTGSVLLSGLPATGNWTLTRNPGGITTTGTGTSTTVVGLTAGTTYTFTVTNAAGCTSAASANVVINAAQTVPTAPVIGTITQPTCSIPTGSVLLSGLPATGTWTLTRIPGGTTTLGTGVSVTISGLAAGTTYAFTVTNAAGCTSAVSASVVINTAPAIPTAPVIGTITQPTCSIPTGSVALTGLPATGTWTLTRIPGGITTTGTGTSRTISGLNSVVTYTFTVTNAAGCTSLASANVVINPVVLITPTFAAIPSLCKGDGAIVLPLSSNNSPAITGIWSPAIVTTTSPGTTRYHFQPNNNQCADTTSIAVTIRDWTSTSFSPIINSMCQNSPAPVLLTTSLNGITGTWDPAVINTAIARTTTYRFMPTAGQCATSASVEVTIIGRIMPTIDDIDPLCIGSTPPSLPLSSTNGITGTWNPATINTATPGTSTYNFNPNAGECAWVKTKDITINSKVKPDFVQIAPLCQNSAAPTLPPKSTNGFTGTWSPSTISTSLAGKTTYTFTPDPDQCATSTTMDIVISGVINPVFIQIDPLCQNSTAPLLPAVSTNGIAGTWNPSTISTLTPGTKIYTFTSNPATCPPTAAMNISVNPQVTPLFNPIGPLCQNSTPPTLPLTSTNGIAGSWSPSTINTAIAVTTKYTFTPNTDQCAVPTTMDITINPPAIPQFTTIGPLCQNSAAPALPLTSTNGYTGTWNPGTISTAKSGTTSYQFTPQSGQCAVEKTMDIVINARTTPNFTVIGPLCLNSIPPPLPTSSLNGIIGTWLPAKIDTTVVGKTKYIFNPSANECAIKDTMVVMVNPIETSTSIVTTCANQLPYKWNGNSYTTSGTFSVKLVSRAGCDSIAKLVMSVITGVTPTFTQIGPIIQNSAPPVLPVTSTNGITGTWTPATISTTDAGTTTYTFTPNLDQCATIAKMDITVQIDAIINGPTVAGSCQQVSLDASQSVGDIVKYEWSLLDTGGELTINSGVKTSFHLSPNYTGTLPANFRVKMLITNRNGYTRSDTITIKMDPLPVADVYASGKLEKDGSMIVDGSVSTGNAINYKWSTAEGKIIGADNQSSVKLYGAGIYNLEISDIHGCLDDKSFKYPLAFHQIAANDDYARTPWDQDVIIDILANDWSTVNLLPGSVTITSAPGRGGTKVNANGTVTYIPQGRHTSTDKFVYRVCDDALMCTSATVTIDVTDIGIKIPEAFSPNGDGANDKLVFPGLIENYPNSQLYVYTRSGQPVYQSANYLNDWNGTTITSTLTNLQIVPTGTYYYVLKLGGTTRIIKGFVYIGY